VPCKGAWRDNIFVERLCRSVKYEEVYLRAYDSVSDARASIDRYFDFYNTAATPFDSLTWQTLHLSRRKICSNNRDHLSRRGQSSLPLRSCLLPPAPAAYVHREDDHGPPASVELRLLLWD
jgi:hypothetical protein